MPKKKRQAKKQLVGKGRLNNAKKWLVNHPQNDLITAYSRRYGITSQVAKDELMKLGYYDDLHIQHYEKEGIEWEYRVEPLSGEMVVGPKGSEEHELYEIHGLF
jgi:hypothetical protein